MNTQHLKYAIEVGKTGSITQAAENLYIGQPSLSKALKELEESLGIVIFKRTSKGAVPTAQGERFLVYARDVLRQVEKMEQLCRAEQLTQARLHISLPRAAYVRRAAQRMAAELQPREEMDVQLLCVSAMRAIQNVAEGISELAVVRYPVRYERYFEDYFAEKKLKYDPIWEGERTLLMNANHPLQALPWGTELKQGSTEIGYCDETVPYLSGEEAEETPVGGNVGVADSRMLLELLKSIDNAVAWCDDFDAQQAREEGLLLRRDGTGGHVRDVLVYPNGYVFRECDQKFIDLLYLERNRMVYHHE